MKIQDVERAVKIKDRILSLKGSLVTLKSKSPKLIRVAFASKEDTNYCDERYAYAVDSDFAEVILRVTIGRYEDLILKLEKELEAL